MLIRSTDRGNHWQEISPDLTTNNKAKIAVTGTAISYCTITTIAESPLQAGVIWVGTDDGKVQLTRDEGVNWIDRTARIAAAGAPESLWTSRVFASPHAARTAYVEKTGFRMDVFKPYVLKTTDYGATWTSISSNLPEAPVNVIIQDRQNPNLLFVGTDQGVYVSINDGKSWTHFKSNMPSVKVTDLVVHPRENDLVVGTYGRGLYVTNISTLQQMSEKVLNEDAHLFAMKPKSPRITSGWGNYRLLGDRNLSMPNEPNAISIDFYLKEAPKDSVRVTVADDSGHVLTEIPDKAEAGINHVYWDMRGKRKEDQPAQPGRFRFELPLVDPGEYVVTVQVGDKKLSGKAVVKTSRGWSLGPFPVDEK